MKLKSYLLLLAAMTLDQAATLIAEQNSAQATVSSVVSCVSTGKQRQQCPADT